MNHFITLKVNMMSMMMYMCMMMQNMYSILVRNFISERHRCMETLM